MLKEFLIISNKHLPDYIPEQLDFICKTDKYSFFAKKEFTLQTNETIIFLDGYILPVFGNSDVLPTPDQNTLLHSLYIRYGNAFIHHIKGIFTIILIRKNESLKIYNDQLGLNKFYFVRGKEGIHISNNFKRVSKTVKNLRINANAVAVKALLNHEVNGETIFTDIQWSKPASEITIDHQQISFHNYWNSDSLLNSDRKELKLDFFADFIRQTIQSHKDFLKPNTYSITLTGGKDSRTALAALLSEGINPVGITYGNPLSKDAVYASLIANKTEIEHEIVNPEKSKIWFQKMADEIILLNNPLINIHRSHRLWALKRIQEISVPDVAYYGGYMGGELLMGIYYDNLIFTDFLTNYWENDTGLNNIPELIRERFIRKESVDLQHVADSLTVLKTFGTAENKKTRQFNGLFEIGILHHSQDIQMALQFIDFPLPFFLDMDFLKFLFQSEYSFLNRHGNSRNPYERHHLFRFNLSMQHLLFPQLDKIPFAKRGSYNTSEFLRGPIYWSVVRGVRYLFQNQKYPPTFNYTNEYRDFIYENLIEIKSDKNSEIHHVYDVDKALTALGNSKLLSSENKWHRFSNIVMHYLQLRKYSNEI